MSELQLSHLENFKCSSKRTVNPATLCLDQTTLRDCLAVELLESSFCLSSSSWLTSAMTFGCTRHSNRSLVERDARERTSSWGYSANTAASWLLWRSPSPLSRTVPAVLHWESETRAHWGLRSLGKLRSLGHASFIVKLCPTQGTGIKWGPNGGEKQGTFLSSFWLDCALTTPLESRFKERLPSCPCSESSFGLLFSTQACTARLRYCMFSSWDVTPSCNTDRHKQVLAKVTGRQGLRVLQSEVKGKKNNNF